MKAYEHEVFVIFLSIIKIKKITITTKRSN